MHRNKSVNVHQFAMVPRADVPRSSFRIQKGHKTAFDAGKLIPIYLDEVLPGDSFNLKMTAFARLATPIFPFMDNLYLESFFFFVPNRLVWDNWVKMMGEQTQPTDSISFTVPQLVSPVAGYTVGSLQDYMGLPTVGQVAAGNTFTHSALFLRAYNLIWNEWFRDQNLQNSATFNTTDGPDNLAWYTIQRRGKRHDYFTSCLPFVQKGTPPTVPLGTSAPVARLGNSPQWFAYQSGTNTPSAAGALTVAAGGGLLSGVTGVTLDPGTLALQTNLSAAVTTTVNQIRQSFQIQRLLERDARGGTRYTELNRAHFGVVSPDSRLQRPEYLGGGSTPITVNPIAQTSATGVTGSTAPLGNLSGFATALAHNHGFTQSFTEHGMIIGLVSVRADLTYQQGLRKMWSRLTRYDFYFPVFAMLGEQAVLNKEIYLDGSATDALTFGYQERWAEYRYNPSQITGLMRSTNASTIDAWHLSQRFGAVPTLNTSFIEDNPPLARVLAVGAGAAGQQLIFDSFFDVKAVRPMPLYSVPGMIDHF